MSTYTISPRALLTYISNLKKRTVRESPYITGPKYPPELIDQVAAKFYEAMEDHVKRALNGRFERGVTLAKQGAVVRFEDPQNPNSHRVFKVRSSDPYRSPYLVDLDWRFCECPDHRKTYICKHRIAANIIERVEKEIQKPNAQPEVKEVDPPAQQAVNPQPGMPSPNTKPTPQNGGTPQDETPLEVKAFIWGVIRHEGQLLGVELLDIGEDSVTVRALPKIVEGNKLQPQFPFPGKRSTATVPKKEISHVKVFQ